MERAEGLIGVTLESYRSLRDARDRAWHAWRGWWVKEHLESPGDPEPDARSAWEAGWNQGGADALRRSAQAAELTLRLEELTFLYREGSER